MTDVWAATESWAELCFGAGFSGDIMVATPMGFAPVQDLRVGDLLRTSDGRPTKLTSLSPARNEGWLRIPALALGNRRAFVVGQGQGLLIESSFAQRIAGATSVVVPALALRGWRGVSTCPAPARALRLQTQRPALVLAAAGGLIAVGGTKDGAEAASALPPVPNLSLASAQQVIACMIAYEAGAALRDLRPQAAVF